MIAINNISTYCLKKCVLVICLTFPVWLSAQLYLQDDAELLIKSSLTTKQSDNIFESSVSGDGVLNFRGSENQNITTRENISIPEVFINNVKFFTISKNLTIRGDVTLLFRIIFRRLPLC